MRNVIKIESQDVNNLMQHALKTYDKTNKSNNKVTLKPEQNGLIKTRIKTLLLTPEQLNLKTYHHSNTEHERNKNLTPETQQQKSRCGQYKWYRNRMETMETHDRKL